MQQGPASVKRQNDYQRKQVTPERDIVLTRHNDFIDMSSINILTNMHPNRKKNVKIIKKYNPQYTSQQYPITSKNQTRSLAPIKKGGDKADALRSSVMTPPDQHLEEISGSRVKHPTVFRSFLDGQLHEAKSRVDNFSQGDSFFRTINQNIICMDQRAKVGYPMDKKPRFKKNIHGSPLMLRESFMGLENFPKPSPEVKNLILEDVNRHHQDSSEDEAQDDLDFQAHSKRLTQVLVDGLHEDQRESIEESMKNRIYERAVANNSVTDELLVKLGMLDSPAPVLKQVKKAGYSVVQPKRIFELSQRNFNSRSVITKLIKTKDRPSKKTYKLKVENINEEYEGDSDPDNRANSKNVGLPQINEFYKKCKDIDKRLQKNQHKHNTHIAYLSKAKALPIVPLPAGLSSIKGRNGEINLYNHSIGNMQAQAIGTAIKHSKAGKISFQNNRLTNKGALTILQNLNENITEINLSDNFLEDNENKQAETMHRIKQSVEYESKKENQYNLKYYLSPVQIKKIQEREQAVLAALQPKEKGEKKKKKKKEVEVVEDSQDEENKFEKPKTCIDILCKNLEEPWINIQGLYLNRCKLTDAAAIQIYDVIHTEKNVKIRKIYMNQNNLSDKTALRIAQIISEPNTQIKEIGLKWNKFTAVAGNKFAEVLCDNKDLKVLDLSWNALGVRPKDTIDPRNPIAQPKVSMPVGDIGRAWGLAFINNKTLVHLDLSFNKFNQDETNLMSQDLVNNQTLVGLHYNGNMGNLDRLCGKIDSQGFMKLQESYFMDPTEQHLNSGIPDGTPEPRAKKITQVSKQLDDMLTTRSNIWQNRLGGSSVLGNGHMINRDSALSMIPPQAQEGTNSYSSPGRGDLFDANQIENYVQIDSKLQNCWICENWVECEFEIDLVQVYRDQFEEDLKLEDDLSKVYRVYMHFDFDDYEPDRMEDMRQNSLDMKGIFKVERMVPQGRYHYFFSFENRCFQDLYSLRVKIGQDTQLSIRKLIRQTNRYGFEIEEFDLEYLNQLNTKPIMNRKVEEMIHIEKAAQQAIQDAKDEEEYNSDLSPARQRDRDRSEQDDSNEVTYDVPEADLMEKSQSYFNVSTSLFPNTPGQPIQQNLTQECLQISGMQSLQNTPNLFQQIRSSVVSVENTTHESYLSIEDQGLRSSFQPTSTMNTPYVVPNLELRFTQKKDKKIVILPKFPEDRPKYKLMNSDTYEMNFKYCSIRPDKAMLSKARVETPWTVKMGIFKDYLKEQKPTLINDCFEFDWENMKKLKYKKSEESDIKAEMKAIYLLIKEFYRTQAGYSPNGNVFSIGMNQMGMFMGSEVLDCIDLDADGKLKSSDCDRLFITVNATGKRLPTNPANAMIRCQTMEFIIRAAIEKFYASGQVENEHEAVKKFIEEYIIPKCTQYDQTKWRYENTFNVYVDNVIKVYEPLFKKIWSMFNGKHKKPGAKIAMMQDEFEEFVINSGLINDALAQRECSVIFNLSMMTQVDELDKERHLNAQPIEFMEMFCRLAKLASFAPPPYKNEDGELIESDMSLTERQAQPLSVKIENCLPTVMLNILDKKFLANFNHPKKDVKKNLYYLPNGKFF